MEKSKIMFIVIIALLVILIGIIGFISFKAFDMLNNGNEGNDNVVVQDNYVSISDLETVELSSPISTNLKTGASGLEYSIRVSIAIGVNNTDKDNSPKIIDLLTTKEAIVRDICLSVITNMTYEELKAGDTQSILSKAILLRLQEEFETNLIYDVYVSDIYIQ